MTEQKKEEVALQKAPEVDTSALEKAAHLMVTGDISKMNMVQKADFLTNLAKAYNLAPFPRPFELIPGRNGKEIIYANKACTDQLRKLYGVSIVEMTEPAPLKVGEKVFENTLVVRVKAQMPDGRTDMAVGAINIAGLNADEMANAPMKCETKAKRRVTLSICGLSFLDESEVGTFGNTQGYGQQNYPSGPRQITPPPLTSVPVEATVVAKPPMSAPVAVSNEPLPPVGAPKG